VVAKELLDRLSSLMYGLEWDDDRQNASLPGHAIVWETSQNQDIIILNDFLFELISELNQNEITESSGFQTPSDQTSTMPLDDDPSAEEKMSCILFRILVIRHIICALLDRSTTSRLRINDVSSLFTDKQNYFLHSNM